jgi:hypothetical protein
MWTTAKGGCHCGLIRYEVRRSPIWSGYCHCRSCQKASGTPIIAWCAVPVRAFAYVAGQPAVYRSSDNGERRFCPRCGTQLEFRHASGARVVEVYVATLDEPGRITPQLHQFTAERIPWFDTRDDLPRFEQRATTQSAGAASALASDVAAVAAE